MASEKQNNGRSMLPDSQSFQQHAERMRDFRLVHSRTKRIKTGGIFSPLGRLHLIPTRGITLKLSKAVN